MLQTAIGWVIVSALMQNLDKNKPVFVYCKSGNRSGKAVKKLEELGFKSIYELDGGLQNGEAAGMKKLKSKTEGMTIEEYENLLASEKIVLISFKTDCTCKQVETYLKKLEKNLAKS
jgi:3-mercaptopyruvate sulfurtransferase SseA